MTDATTGDNYEHVFQYLYDLGSDSSAPPWTLNVSRCLDWLNVSCLGGTLNDNETDLQSDDTLPNNGWAVILLIFPVFTLFGNSLVVLSVFKEKSLRTATNYFIISLATSDIMVALLVMPFQIYVEVSRLYVEVSRLYVEVNRLYVEVSRLRFV